MSAAALAKLADISNGVTYYFTVTIVPIGILINILSTLVFLRKNIRSTNMAFYNQMISITNAFTLLFYLLVYQSALLFNDNFFAVSDWLCKVLYFVRKTIREIGPIIESVMTFDRLMSVLFPTKYKFLKKKKTIVAIILATFLVYSGISFQNFQYYLSITYKNGTNGSMLVASKSCTATRLVSIEGNFVSASLRSVVPFLIMLVCNLLMIKKLKAKKAIRSRRSSSSDSQHSKESQFTKTVMVLNVWFLILNFPEALLYIVKDVYSFYEPLTSPTGQILTFCWNMVYLLTVLHYIVNNFLNLKYNSIFRKEAFKMLRMKATSVAVNEMIQSITNQMNTFNANADIRA
jgi:hypothetical protein